MQGQEVVASAGAAFTLGCLHTLLGPDHYAPFVAMSRIGDWTTRRTILVTVLCGLGHVGSSILIGLVGVWFGVEVLKLQSIESLRADAAAWLLLAFGLAYTAWGVWRAIRNRPHVHLHVHADGTAHSHRHDHNSDHAHLHTSNVSDPEKTLSRMTPWVLFTIFVFGPCEPLIPLLIYPAARGQMTGIIWIATAFTLATICTMLVVVLALTRGAKLLELSRFERFGHAIAGGVVVMCGLAMMCGL